MCQMSPRAPIAINPHNQLIYRTLMAQMGLGFMGLRGLRSLRGLHPMRAPFPLPLLPRPRSCPVGSVALRRRSAGMIMARCAVWRATHRRRLARRTCYDIVRTSSAPGGPGPSRAACSRRQYVLAHLKARACASKRTVLKYLKAPTARVRCFSLPPGLATPQRCGP